MMMRHWDASRLFFTIPFYKVLRAPDRYTTVNPFLVIQPSADPPFNEDGYRASQSPLAPKKDNEIRIFVMGGSTTANIKLKTSYSQLLEEQLDAHSKDLKVRCFNGARGGWSTNHTLARIATEIVFLEPDIITVMHTANDMHELMFPGVEEEYFVRNAKYFFPRYFPFLQKTSELKSDLLTKVLYNPLLNQHSVLNQVFYRLSVYLESPERNQVALPEGLIERGTEEFRRNLISMVGLATSVNAQLVLISQPHRFALSRS